MNVAFYTLGCKLNQLETESIADAFRGEGFNVVPWEDNKTDPVSRCSIRIINTCTVTSKSEQKARRIIRKVLRDPSQPVVIVSGCYAQLEADALEALNEDKPKRLFVIPGEHKDRILELPRFLAGFSASDFGGAELTAMVSEWVSGANSGERFLPDNSFCFQPGQFSFHSRAFLKIQDGCDNSCAYCRVSLARGKSRSLDADKVLDALKALEEKGYAEAVLTGVNISQYRGKGEKPVKLPQLLEYLLSETEKIRLRLSSIEPEILDSDFFGIVSHSRIQPHFHISMQSASPYVLNRMKRNYDPAAVLDGINRLRTAKNDPFLGCDIITGFPGESVMDFENSFEFCQKAGFAGIHAFPFSRRPGTEAWDFKDRVSEKEAGLRAHRLIELAGIQRKEYIGRCIGREVEAIVINTYEEAAPQGFIPLLSANYLKLLVPAQENSGKAGTLVLCRIEKGPSNPPNLRFDAMAKTILI